MGSSGIILNRFGTFSICRPTPGCWSPSTSRKPVTTAYSDAASSFDAAAPSRTPGSWTRPDAAITCCRSPTGGDLIWHYAALYRRDLWFTTDVYVEVWCESESIGAVIQSECDRLGVSLYPTRGFSSVTLTSQAAEGIRAWSRERPVKIVYVGDYDPAGVLIDDKVMAELRQHLPNHDLEKIRVAITAEQAVKLPSKPRRKGEKRRRDILRTVEAEAMPAGELRALLGASVEAFLPPGALHAAQVAERAERDGLQRLAELTSELGVQAVNSIIENAPPRRSRDDV